MLVEPLMTEEAQRRESSSYLMSDDSDIEEKVSFNDNIVDIQDEVQKEQDQTENKFDKFIGITLIKLSEYIGLINKVYYLLLCNAGLLSLVFIICNIANNTLWNSEIIRSDSQYWLLFAYICLMYSYNLKSLFYLRIVICLASIFFVLFGIYGIPGFVQYDTIIWNVFMVLINIQRLFGMKYENRYIPFNHEFEQLYLKTFKPYLSRLQFQKLVKIAYIRQINKGEILRKKNSEIVELAFLIKGRVEILRSSEVNNSKNVSKRDTMAKLRQSIKTLSNEDLESLMVHFDEYVNVIHEYEFIDGKEWIIFDLNPKNRDCVYEIAAIATCDSIYIGWPKDSLIELLNEDPSIRQAMLNGLGICTAKQYIRETRVVKAKGALEDLHLIHEEQTNKISIISK